VKITIILLVVINVSLIFAQNTDTLDFPFEIHNKWYYIGDNNQIITKEITSKTGTQYTIIMTSQGNYLATEYWSIENNCLFFTSNQAIYTDGYPIFIAGRHVDTTFLYIGIDPDRKTIDLKIINDTLWGNNLKQEFQYWNEQGHFHLDQDIIRTANKVGIYYQFNVSNLSGMTLSLIGMLINGVLTGDSTVTTVNDANHFPLTYNYNLFQNYPNPFNPSTKISFSIPSKQIITIKVYDILGNEISTLINEEKSSGLYVINFNGENLPSGIYFCKLQAKNFAMTKKMILLK
jgi:hypothetical protein